jgi:hypothetical protein
MVLYQSNHIFIIIENINIYNTLYVLMVFHNHPVVLVSVLFIFLLPTICSLLETFREQL